MHRIPTLVLLLAAPLGAQTAAPLHYELVEIHPGPAIGYDIDGSGRVSGRQNVGFEGIPFRWSDGRTTFLPRIAGMPGTHPTHIDASGRILGYAQDTSGPFPIFRPLQWATTDVELVDVPFTEVTASPLLSDSGTYLVLNTHPFDSPTPGWSGEFGWEEEAEFSSSSRDPLVPVLLRGDEWVVLGTPEGSFGATGRDVSDTGVVVGYADYGGFNLEQAWRYDLEQGMLPLGTAGARSSRAEVVNARGQIAASMRFTDAANPQNDYRSRPFLWEKGAWHELVVPEGIHHARPTDINASGTVVGAYAPASNPFDTNGAWIARDGHTLDLEELVTDLRGWNLTQAIAINDAGWILVGERTGPGFLDSRLALLIPETPATTFER